MSENQPECSTGELEGVNTRLKGPKYPRSDLAPLMCDKNIADVRISSQKGRKFTKSTILQKLFSAQV